MSLFALADEPYTQPHAHASANRGVHFHFFMTGIGLGARIAAK